jgi:hypothetical protein
MRSAFSVHRSPFTVIMGQEVFDASDIHTNTGRFCDECRQMAAITGLSFHRRFSKPGLAKEATMPHRGLANWRDAPDPKCALCGFLDSELNKGSGEYLFGRVGINIKGFALRGKTRYLLPPSTIGLKLGRLADFVLWL